MVKRLVDKEFRMIAREVFDRTYGLHGDHP